MIIKIKIFIGFSVYTKIYMKNNKKSYGRNRNFSNSFKKRNFRNKKNKILDSKLFIKKAVNLIDEEIYTPSKAYSEMNLNPKLIKSLEFKKFKFPTEIQDKSIEYSVSGKNILGIASTGTGKTGAFLIPIIDKILNNDNFFQSIVIAPTRELANQIQADFISMTKNLNLNSVCFVGGSPIFKDFRKLKMKNHLIIGTPGRLIDLVKREKLNLNKIEILVLDEFDRMLDMGFINDVKFLLGKMTNLKQNMLFSATLNNKIEPIINSIIENPYRVIVNSNSKTSDNVEQGVIKINSKESKFEKLLSMINQTDFKKVIIFTETKRAVDNLHKNLKNAGVKVEYIHGDKTQRAREYSLKNFSLGKANILIATDVAARGLDIKGVTHVINYETPRDYDSYIHRIGRTGRAGAKGYAYTFIS